MPLFKVGETVQVMNSAGPLSRLYPRVITGYWVGEDTGWVWYEYEVPRRRKGKQPDKRDVPEWILLEWNPERIPLLPESVQL